MQGILKGLVFLNSGQMYNVQFDQSSQSIRLDGKDFSCAQGLHITLNRKDVIAVIGIVAGRTQRVLKRNAVAASPHMERFKAHLESFQEAYRRMASVVEDAEREAPEVAQQLKRVMDELVKRLAPSTEGEGV